MNETVQVHDVEDTKSLEDYRKTLQATLEQMAVARETVITSLNQLCRYQEETRNLLKEIKRLKEGRPTHKPTHLTLVKDDPEVF